MNPLLIKAAQQTAKHAAQHAAQHAMNALPTIAKHFGPVAFAKANLIRHVAPYAGPAGLMVAAAFSAAIYKITTKENVCVKVKTKVRSITVRAKDNALGKIGRNKNKRQNMSRHTQPELSKVHQSRLHRDNRVDL